MVRPPSRALAGLAVVLLSALMVGPGAALAGVPGTVARTPGASPSAAHPAVNHTSPWLTGSDSGTLVLFNRTIQAGGFLPALPTHPQALQTDVADDQVWVTAGSYAGSLGGSSNLGVDWVSVGAGAGAMTLNNRTDVLFVAAATAGNVSLLNATTHRVTGTVTGLSDPDGLAYDYLDNTVFVAEHSVTPGRVAVLNATTGAFVTNVTVGKSPVGVAFDATDHRIFVANSGSQNISVINSTVPTLAPTNVTIKPSTPTNLLFNPTDDHLYVSGIVSAVDVLTASTGAVLTTIHAGSTDVGLALSNDGGTLYITDSTGGAVYLASTASNLVTSHFGTGMSTNPIAVAYVPSQGAVFVANSPPGPVSVSNITVANSTGSITGGIALDAYPSALAPAPDRHVVYAYDGGSGLVFELNASTLAVNRSVFVGYSAGGLQSPNGLAYDPADGRLIVDYGVTGLSGAAIVSLSSFAVVKSFLAGMGAGSIAYDGYTHDAFVVNHGSNNVTVLNVSAATKLSALRINVGLAPTAAVYDPGTHAVYVTNSASDNVSILNGSNATPGLAPKPQLAVGIDPIGAVYDARLARVVVADAGGTNLTLIDPSTNTTTGSVAVNTTQALAAIGVDPVGGAIVVASSTLGQPVGRLVYLGESNLSFAGAFPIAASPASVAYDADRAATLVASTPTGTIGIVNVTVHPAIDILSFGSNSPINVNQTAFFAVNASGGGAPYTYNYTGLPPGCTSQNSSSLTCVANQSGTFDVVVNVSDPLGNFARANTTFQVIGEILGLQFAVVPSRIALGNTTTLYLNATGGVPPYSYWQSGLPQGCIPANVSVLRCTPIETGNFTLRGQVNDSEGYEYALQASLNVTPAGSGGTNKTPLSSVALTVTPASLTLGNNTTFVATPVGGEAPLSFAYTGLPVGCSSANTSRLVCTPAAAGNYSVTVLVTDHAGATAQNTTHLTVLPAPKKNTSGSPSGSGTDWLLIGGIALALVIVVAAVGAVLLRRRRTPPAEPADGAGSR